MADDITRKEILESIDFGKRIAEEEADELARYFHVTEQYKGVRRGDTEVIYGQKGAGKSAMYAALKNDSDNLVGDGILLVPAENPRGAPAFKDIEIDPPASEREFETLWKLYFLSLIAAKMKEWALINDDAQKKIKLLEKEGLITGSNSLSKMLRAALAAARRLINFNQVSTTLEFDPVSGLPSGVTGSLTLAEPTREQEMSGAVSLNEVYRTFDESLKKNGVKIWVCIDRLDVAFAENEILEANSLRALFRVYRDVDFCTNVRLRIFLRSDIWDKITKQGFREASHITRHTTIRWGENDLLSLVVRRMVQSQKLLNFLSLSRDQVLASFKSQTEFFYQVFPDKVFSGQNQSKTFDWVLSRTTDATNFSAPREILHLLSTARSIQIRRLENGHSEATTALLDRTSLKESLIEVSQVRLEQTLFQEYPSLRDDILAFKESKAEQTLKSAAALWHCDNQEAFHRAKKLTEIGFWYQSGEGDDLRFKIPFLYRPYLELKQGVVEENDE